MRIPYSSSTLLLLFFSCLSLTSALLTTEEVVALADGKKLSPSADSSTVPPSKPAVDGVGTKDAPVDGKDGRPHLGPFVETSAERDRKKAKESGDEVKVSKPIPSALSGGDVPKEDVQKMPETNDGVMDDPNRTGPKEGTRGTEGGISEKSKDGKESQVETGKSEKKPDPPKEIPPLPHSEQETLGQNPAKDDVKKGKEVGVEDEQKQKDNKQKELGGLEVSCESMPDSMCILNIFDTETCRPSAKTSRHTTSCPRIGIQKRPPCYSQTLRTIFPCPDCGSCINNTTATLIRSLANNDNLLGDW